MSTRAGTKSFHDNNEPLSSELLNAVLIECSQPLAKACLAKLDKPHVALTQ